MISIYIYNVLLVKF